MTADGTVTVGWSALETTWKTLRRITSNYNDGSGWDCLVEACRLVEIEMRAQGFEDRWQALTNGFPVTETGL